MQYIRQFSSESEYLDFKETPDFITPNVSLITDSYTVMFNEYVPPISLCDIAYWDGSRVQTTTLNKWSESLGTPIGVVVIPERFLPDGKARMVALTFVDMYGNANPIIPLNQVAWGPILNTTNLIDFNRVPTTDNSSSITTGSDGYGYLPSDAFTGTQSFVDAQAKYSQSSSLIPSPYLNDTTMNSAYSEAISGYNNVLSDFNGLSNTQTLVGAGSAYKAANAAWNYSDGVSSTQWYLPAMGELGFLMPRLNAINAVIMALRGVGFNAQDYPSIWSSSQDTQDAFYLNQLDGEVNKMNKVIDRGYYVRPFAML